MEFNLLAARLMLAERRPLAGARPQLVANAEAVLAEATASKEPLVEARAHRVLGELLAATEPERAALHVQRCLDIEAALGFPRLRADCLWSLSRLQSASDPRLAEQSSETGAVAARSRT